MDLPRTPAPPIQGGSSQSVESPTAPSLWPFFAICCQCDSCPWILAVDSWTVSPWVLARPSSPTLTGLPALAEARTSEIGHMLCRHTYCGTQAPHAFSQLSSSWKMAVLWFGSGNVPWKAHVLDTQSPIQEGSEDGLLGSEETVTSPVGLSTDGLTI